MKIKKIIACIVAFSAIAATLTSCSDKEKSEKKSAPESTSVVTEKTTVAEATANSADITTKSASPTTETPDVSNTSAISFSEIENIDDGTDIVQIYGLNSETETPGINTFNNIITNGILMKYNEFLNRRDDISWIEIKAQKSLNENYAQILYTENIFPNYANQGEIYSVNYDIKNDEVLTIDDAIVTAFNLPDGVDDAESMAECVKTVYPTMDEWIDNWGSDVITEGEMVIESVEVFAFMLPCAETDNNLRFYLKAVYKNTNGDPSFDYQDLLVYDTDAGTISAFRSDSE